MKQEFKQKRPDAAALALALALADALGPHPVHERPVRCHSYTTPRSAAAAAKRRSVKRLTQTYLTLSLADIAAKTGLEGESVESTILEMIEKGEIFASINQRDGMVSFLDNPEQVT